MIHRRSSGGFTVIDLMIAAVIVAILAAVAIPVRIGARNREVVREAEAGLVVVRQAVTRMFGHTGAYNVDPNGQPIKSKSPVTVIPGLSPEMLDGRYFSGGQYRIDAVSPTNYIIAVRGTGVVHGVLITLDQDGVFRQRGL